MKVADFVGYLQMSGKDRVLDFNPTDRWIGKNPAGWAPFKLPSVAKSTDFMADLFTKGRAALGQLSDASAVLMRQVESWRETIDAFTDAAAFTKAVSELSVVEPPIVQAQVRKLLWDSAQARGFVFDKEQKVFIEPVKA